MRENGPPRLDVFESVDAMEDWGEELDAIKLDAVRDALRDLRLEIRTQRERLEPSADVEKFDWLGLVDELRHRLGGFGMAERSNVVDEFGLEQGTVDRSHSLLEFLRERYWRVEVRGAENIPTDAGCLFVANHSGLLPYDGLMLSHIVNELSGNRPRFLVADWLITLPFVQPYLARLGGVRACRENADRLLRTGRSVVAFPEGAKGAAKVFGDRYRLKRFGRGGVVRAAFENQVSLVPVGIVGAEEAHPILFKSQALARPLGLPFIPVTPTFPLLGPLGLLPLPTRWVVTFGEPIDLSGASESEVQDELLVSQLTEELRALIQILVGEGLDARESLF